ncbi:MAG: hypothetical protein D3924_17765 [Candidatus Electrothrix sp. AR4]|nr:hypothetical protein [Candidatus Electrothrix sp. AR4]
MLHVEILPVAGTSIDTLDLDRLNFYLSSIIEDQEVPTDREHWIERLLGLGLMAENGLGNTVCSIVGLVCFGIHPRRFLPQSGLRGKAIFYPLQAVRETVVNALWILKAAAMRIALRLSVLEPCRIP